MVIFFNHSEATTQCKQLQDLDLSQFTDDKEVIDSHVGAAKRLDWCVSAVQAMLARPLLPEVFPESSRFWATGV